MYHVLISDYIRNRRNEKTNVYRDESTASVMSYLSWIQQHGSLGDLRYMYKAPERHFLPKDIMDLFSDTLLLRQQRHNSPVSLLLDSCEQNTQILYVLQLLFVLLPPMIYV